MTTTDELSRGRLARQANMKGGRLATSPFHTIQACDIDREYRGHYDLPNKHSPRYSDQTSELDERKYTYEYCKSGA